MGKSTKRFILGTIVAAFTGYIAGILTAPKSGKETREDVKEAAVNTVKAGEKQLKRLEAEIESLLAQAKDLAAKVSGKTKINLDEAMAKVEVARDKARKVLSAVSSGEVEDKDLQKAVDEATKAVDHLRSFLSKS